MTLITLPVELIKMITQWLPTRDYLRLCRCNKRLASVRLPFNSWWSMEDFFRAVAAKAYDVCIAMVSSDRFNIHSLISPAEFAAAHGALSVLKKIFQKYPTLQTPFCLVQASRHGQLHIVQYLVEELKMPLNFNDHQAFHHAAAHGHTRVLRYQLSLTHGSQPILNLALIAACQNGHESMVDLLLEANADPTASNHYPFIAACTNGYLTIVKRLLQDNRVNPAAQSDFSFIIACEKGLIDIVRLLIQDPRVSPHAVNDYGIRGAAENGHFDIVKILIQDPRVNPHVQNSYVLRRAKIANQHEIIHLLSQ
ncbi:ankyrin repeat-containing domain protein [Gorgonomyces haynaldii]|nr:ankyrin repeat-containing domain protein [Gorgonomyces haynaldii]